jgi:hypothetical protein
MKSLTTSITCAIASLIVFSLAGCGGGGGGGGGDAAAPSGPVTSTLSFPLETAYKTLIAYGLTKSFTVTSTSPTCSGSGTRTSAPAATAATFEGVAALSAAHTLTISLTNCTPASSAQTSTNYYDSNYVPLGFNTVGGHYGVYLTPLTIPTSVTVGGTATVGTETIYTDSTKATVYGTIVLSYVVEADTATTAIVNLIAKSYNASSTLLWTEQVRYRIAATGALTPVSADIQYASASGSTMHMILTYN